jgi:hypothetical protein
MGLNVEIAENICGRAQEDIQWGLSIVWVVKCNLYRLIQLIRARADHVIFSARNPQACIATDLKIYTMNSTSFTPPRHFRSSSRPDPYPSPKNAFQSLSNNSHPTNVRTTSSVAGAEPQRRSHLGGAILVNFPSPSWSVSPFAFTLCYLEIYCDESNA